MHLRPLFLLPVICSAVLTAGEDLLGDQPPPPPPPANQPRTPGPVDGGQDPAAARLAAAGLRRLMDQGKEEVRQFNQDKARNANAIVDAAIDFAKARQMAGDGADPETLADIQANLFWCKKQMDVDAIKDYLARKGDEGKLGLAQMDAVAALKPDPSQAKAYLARADEFAKANPADPLQQAVRYLEVAERFPSTPEGTEGNKRAIDAQQRLMKANADAAAAARATRFTRAPAVAARGQIAAPDAAAEKEALATLKKTYAKEFAKRDPKDKRRLARKLLDDAPANKGDAAIYHAELSEALRLAGECEDYVRVLDAIDQLGAAFKGYDPAAEKVANLKRIGKPVALAILKLLDTPEDPAANTAAGKWFAFTAHRWPEGLPMLSRSGDEVLAKAAQMEMDKPVTPEEQVQVGDGWYDLGKKSSAKDERSAMLGRALSWYQQAQPRLAGLAKDKIAARMTEIDKLLPLDLDHVDWNSLTVSQWDKLKGTVVAVQAKLERSETGVGLTAGQKVRVVPHPTDMWTFTMSYNYGKITCGWRGQDPRRQVGATTYYSFMGIAGQPYGAMLNWLDNGDKSLAGVVTGPGRLWVGPSTDRSWESDTSGAIRVKILAVEDDE